MLPKFLVWPPNQCDLSRSLKNSTGSMWSGRFSSQRKQHLKTYVGCFFGSSHSYCFINLLCCTLGRKYSRQPGFLLYNIFIHYVLLPPTPLHTININHSSWEKQRGSQMAVLRHALSFKGIRHRGMVPHGFDALQRNLLRINPSVSLSTDNHKCSPQQKGVCMLCSNHQLAPVVFRTHLAQLFSTQLWAIRSGWTPTHS